MNRIKINLIAGGGVNSNGIFSDMIERFMIEIDSSKFELTITESVDESKLYDVYHYFHSTLSILNQEKMLHRSLITIHGLDMLAPNRAYEPKEMSFLKARKISAVSNDSLEILKDRGISPNKLYFTPAGIDIKKFSCATQKEKLDLRYYGKFKIENKFTIGIVGTRYPDGRKGEDFLRSIIEKLYQKSYANQINFIFLGNGWNGFVEKEIPYHIKQKINFKIIERFKDCEYEDYPDIYKLMDVLVVPSKVDTGPVPIIEALASGVPVISTPTGLSNLLLTKRFTNGEKFGSIISYGDINSFIDEFENFFMGGKRLYSMAEEKRIIIPSMVSDFTWENFTKRFEDIYLEIYHECKEHKFIDDYIKPELKQNLIRWYSDSAKSNLTDKYLENYMLMEDHVKKGASILPLEAVAKNIPAAIIGVGPSLDDDIDLLFEKQEDVMIFACDAALPTLANKGILPDVVVVADPSNRQVKNFTNIDCSSFITCMPSVVHNLTYKEASKNDAKIMWFHISDPNISLCKWLPFKMNKKGFVRPSVLTAGMVLQIALYMGCSPITFLGSDLAWTKGIEQGYASSVFPEKAEFQKMTKMFNQPVFLLPDINDNIVVTDISFINFVRWIDNYLEEHNINVYNSSNDGILYGGRIYNMPFNDWLNNYSLPKKDVRNKLINIYLQDKLSFGDKEIRPK